MPCRDFGVEEVRRVHFIGVGGVGMSGIASVCHEMGMQVSGSDLKDSRYVRALVEEGVDVTIGHAAENVTRANPDVVVASSAIPPTNPEIVAAKEAGIPIWRRAKMLAYVCQGYKLIAVAGTHGKTTTSSCTAASLVRLGADPTFLVGGTVDEFGSNARYGAGEYCVIEADESDGSFTYYDPYIAIITNIEEDHLDHYSGIEDIRAAFGDFISEVPEDGCVIACCDCDGVEQTVRSSTKAHVITYGFSEGADVVVRPQGDGSFETTLPGGKVVHGKMPNNPGVHNMLNASAVITALVQLGYDPDLAAQTVSQFGGVRRRFDLVGEAKGVTVVDDYGHHPNEIAATLKAAKAMGYKRIHVLFQPHRYTRTQALAEKFGPAFDDADKVTVMDVYSAGETPIPGVTGKTVVDSVLAHDPGKDISWVQGRSEVVPYLIDTLEPGDLLMTMGAGDVTSIGPEIIASLEGED